MLVLEHTPGNSMEPQCMSYFITITSANQLYQNAYINANAKVQPKYLQKWRNQYELYYQQQIILLQEVTPAVTCTSTIASTDSTGYAVTATGLFFDMVCEINLHF